MDLNLIRAKLEQLQQGPKSSNSQREQIFWSPSPGTSTIRILPNPYNADYPFTELQLYYNFGGTVLSPSSYGQPDPILDFARKLAYSKDNTERELAKRLFPVRRTYALILERGKESEGPKYWNFNQTVYRELLAYIADPDYGDITHPLTGRDVTIEYILGDGKTEREQKRNSKITVRVKPRESKAFEDPTLLEKIKAMKPLSDIFPIPAEDTLKTMLEKYLSGTADSTTDQPTITTKSLPDPVVATPAPAELPSLTSPDDTSAVNSALDEINRLFDEYDKK